ncbi:hypothetical protein DCC81_13555 [Chitinophaga parva]|uniref:F5/8 type C domain-containing protein n=1 Tax=Chitinophaga parva TaxID=2169414 RepID=A0A2T7BGB6_9BACT|nr:DUF1735 domain-containing protein [Chitinophaga parva]PUZ25325.1 hypothetical protein DCC81_13555 [Chitinophaga parva]
MRNIFNNKTFASCCYTTVAALAAMVAGCVKSDALYSNSEGVVYMPAAYSDRSQLTIFKVDSIQSATFGAAVGGFHGAGSDLTVNFVIDTSLIAQYNSDNAYQNYHFVAFPRGAYTVSGLTATISKGQTASAPLTLSIDPSKLKTSTGYLLPVRIASVSSGNVDTMLRTAYFRIDSLEIRSRDVTAGGTLSVSNENSAGAASKEGSSHLVDNDYTTKFYTDKFNTTSFWMQLAYETPQVVSAYTLTSGNDAPERDANTWKFQGSDDDGKTWVTLDDRSNFLFSARYQTVKFELNQPDNQPHKLYRVLISKNNGGGVKFQMEEWRVLLYY